MKSAGVEPKSGAKIKPTLYVHIGINKTGTTALQNTLAAHRDALARVGVVYPRAGIHSNAHHLLGWHCGFHQGPPPPMQEPPEAIAQQMKREIRGQPGATGLISSEFLCLDGDIARFKTYLKPFKVKVVVYLRRHDLWLQSVYVQALKTVLNPRWGRGYNAYLNALRTGNPKIGNYRRLVDSWANEFGRENVIVRPFESAQIGSNLLADLMTAIDCPAALPVLPQSMPRDNESLSFEAASFLDVLHHTKVPDELKRFLGAQMVANDRGTQRGIQYLAPEARRAQIAQHQDAYTYIARDFMGRPDGRLFFDAEPSDSSGWTAPVHPTYMWFNERMCEFLGQADIQVIAALRQQSQALRGAA